mgnify:CR=1 FL=1
MTCRRGATVAAVLWHAVRLSRGAFTMLPNGCSWYETHKLGGCKRLKQPRSACSPSEGVRHKQHHRLAVVIPLFGGARKGLPRLCHRLGDHLDRMGVEFDVFAVNQVDDFPFNRGALLNIGVQHALATKPSRSRAHSAGTVLAYDYLALQDIDRFPSAVNRSCIQPAATYYAFPAMRPHALNPQALAGGVLVVSTKLFRAVNGFSNTYWGYGSEDNDLFLRLRWCGLPPIHGAEIDSCMEHRNCGACTSNRASFFGDAGRRDRANYERVLARMREPRVHMLQDGLSSLNFTVQGPPRREACTGRTISVLDVSLGGDEFVR